MVAVTASTNRPARVEAVRRNAEDKGSSKLSLEKPNLHSSSPRLLFGSCTSPVAFNRIEMTGPESKAQQFRALSSFLLRSRCALVLTSSRPHGSTSAA
ncbi:hypothetical protein MUK42_33460 [Musa troglodytarum]|uniref:Uncharacterized protein n=1 Tax=Musa troglodytarum TaxID=320322 RepID=A0A9E7L7K1_9LILI|nr:hypothetical protein MUK42_33460 [Musa troglodytarum]